MQHLVRRTAVLLGAAVLGCSSGDGGTDPDPVVTFAVQVLTAPPATATPGASVPISFRITRQTDGGPAMAAAAVPLTIAVTAGGGSVGGAASTLVTSSASGDVSATWVLGTTPGTQTLRVSYSSSVFADVSVTVSALPAIALAVTTQPAATVLAGATLSRQPVVQLRNASGAAVAQAGVVVTASVVGGTGSLGGTTTATTDASGNATFTNLSIIGVTGNVTLQFAANLSGQAVTIASAAVAVTQPTLAIGTAPTTAGLNGVPLLQQPVVQLQDGAGNAVRQAGVVITAVSSTSLATLGIATGGTGSLSVTTDAEGRAAFRDLTLTGFGAAAIVFSAPGYASVTSGQINLTASTPGGLLNGTPIVAPGAATGNVQYYAFTVPVGTTSLRFATSEGTGNVALYARRDAYPTLSDFNCSSTMAGPAQVCTITSGTLNGTWYVALHSASATTATQVVAYAYNAACDLRPMTLGVTVSGTVAAGSGCLANVTRFPSDRYSLTIATPQLVQLSFAQTQFTAFTIRRLEDPIITYGPQFTTGSSTPFLMAPGTYELTVRNNTVNAPSSAYSYTVTPINAPGTCSVWGWNSTGLAINLPLAAGDCAGTTAGTRSHRISMVLKAGQTVTVVMSSTAFDPVIKILAGQVSGAATPLASDDNGGGGTSARLVYTNTGATALFTLEMTSTNATVGIYTMTGSFSPASYELRADGSSSVEEFPGPPVIEGGRRLTERPRAQRID